MASMNSMAPYAVHFWDLSEKKIRRKIEAKNFPSSLSFSPDGKRLAFLDGGTIRVCDVTDGKDIHRLESGTRTNRAQVTFCCDGKLLALAASDNDAGQRGSVIRLWDAVSGQEVDRLKGHENLILALAAAPKGNLVASAGYDETIRFWDATTRREVGRYRGQFNLALAFSPDGKTLAAANAIGTLHLWHAPTGGEIRLPAERPNLFWWAGFSPNGRTLITAEEGQFALREPLTGQVRRTFADQPRSFCRTALSSNGKTLAIEDEVHEKSGIVLWDLATGQRRCRIPSSPMVSLWPFTFSPDGRTLAARGTLGMIRLFNVADGKEVRQLKGPRFCDALAISPDGTKLASAGLNGQIRFSTILLHDLADGKEIRHKETQPCHISDLAFSPDGRTLALAGENLGQPNRPGEVRLWNADSGAELGRFEGHRAEVARLAFSPDGRTLATGSHDRTIRLWEVASGGQRACFTGHRYFILSLSFSPDGRVLASAGGDFNVLIWDLTGRFREGRFQPRRLSTEERLRCWNALAGSNAEDAYRTIHALAASAEESVTFLAERLPPVKAADPKQMASLLTALESDDFAERKRATAAEPALRRALKGKPSLESRRRIEQILAKVRDSHGLRVLRAIEVLETIGTAEARRVLTALAGGDGSALPTREAKAALVRLTHRTKGKP